MPVHFLTIFPSDLRIINQPKRTNPNANKNGIKNKPPNSFSKCFSWWFSRSKWWDFSFWATKASFSLSWETIYAACLCFSWSPLSNFILCNPNNSNARSNGRINIHFNQRIFYAYSFSSVHHHLSFVFERSIRCITSLYL